MSDGRVTYCSEGGWHVLRYVGRVDYTMAPAIERYLEQIAHGGGEARPFLFDVTDASLIDSTNLGLIARLVERSRGDGASRSAVVCPAGDTDDVIRSMGFEALVDLLAERPMTLRHPAASSDDEEEVVTDEAASQGEMLRTMLEAHRTLAGLDVEDCSQWRDVVTMLEAEMTTANTRSR